MTTFLAIDDENAATTWWDALRATDPNDPALREVKSALLRAEGGVDVPSDIANAFILWAMDLPGWEDGPPHAQHPIFLSAETAAGDAPLETPNMLDLIRTHVPPARSLDLRAVEPSTLRDVLNAGFADGRPILARLAWLGAMVETARTVRPGHVIEIPEAVIASSRWRSEDLEREVEAHGRARLHWVEAITAAEPDRLVFVALPPLTDEDRQRAIDAASAAAGE